MENFKLDFIGIGAPKCGTSWISTCLDEHPDICHSRHYETVFFENQSFYRKGLGYYKKYFQHYKPGQIRGEFTPTYLYSPAAAQRIKECNPKIKILVCLRNPIERAYSHYLAHARNGKNIIWLDSFDEIRHKQNNPYFQRGLYYEPLQQYIKIFPRENILILIHDDSRKDPKKFIQGIYAFLGVNHEFLPPSLFKTVNTAAERGVYSITLNQWLLYGKLGALLSKKLPYYKKIRRWLKQRGVFQYSRRTIEQLNQKNKPWGRVPMAQSTREFLQSAYRQDISKLETLLNRKLDVWQ